MITIKDVVGGDINHPGPDILANFSQVSGGVNVELPGSLHVSLDLVREPLGCRVDHMTGLEVQQELFGGREVSEVQGGQVVRRSGEAETVTRNVVGGQY